MIILIEGNIGSGKSTLLQILKDKYKNRSDVHFVDEPVSEWETIQDDGKSILELFYGDKEKYSFTFQVLAYITRLRLLLNAIEKNPNDIIICERSIFTDKFVFAKMLRQQGYIDNIQWKTYNYWFDTFKDKVKADYIVYVNTEPSICFERIKKRNRNGESEIPIDYLNHCHTLHQEWLCQESSEHKLVTFNGNIEFNGNNQTEYTDNLEGLLI